MVKCLFSVLLVVTIFTVKSQVLYRQDFENGFQDMVLHDIDEKNPAFAVEEFIGSWNIIADNAGNNWAVSNSYFEEAGRANDWMITPLISNITTSTVLNWNAFSFNSLFLDQYEIRVAINGGTNPSDFTTIIYSVEEENANATKRGISLAAFANLSIRIAFRNISNDKYLLYIDDVVVENVNEFDAALTNGLIVKYPLINTSYPVSFQMINRGAMDIFSIVIELKYGNHSFMDTIENINLQYLDSIDLVHRQPISWAIPEKQEVTLIIHQINGSENQNTENNSWSKFIHVLNQPWVKKLFIEELTSVNCGWCPRGIHYVNELYKRHNGEFVHISVHHNDVMQYPTYVEGIIPIFRFQSFPYLVLNRKSVKDGSLVEDLLIDEQQNYAPIRLETLATKQDRAIHISGSAEFNTGFTEEDLKLVVLVAEDPVSKNSTSYNQANHYSGGSFGVLGGFELLDNPILASDIEYRNVVRELPFGFSGDSMVFNQSFIAGDQKQFSYDFTIGEDIVLNNAVIVLLVLDAEDKVVFVSDIKLNEVSVVEQENKLFSFYPNPGSGLLFINDQITENQDVKIFDSSGKVVYVSKLEKPFMDLRFLSNGLYHIRTSFKGQNISGSVVIRH